MDETTEYACGSLDGARISKRRRGHIASRAVTQFSQLFRASRHANLTRPARYWRARDELIESYKPNGRIGNDLFHVYHGVHGVKVRISKHKRGRGRKRAHCVLELHKDLVEEFERLEELGVKFNHDLLHQLGLRLINEGDSLLMNKASLDPRTGTLLSTRITSRRVQFILVS